MKLIGLACACVLGTLSVGRAAFGGGPEGAEPAPRSLPASLVRDGAITRWDEGMPIGNGLLGVLVWGEKNVVRLSLDRGDLWDTRVPETFKRPEWTYAEMVRLKKAGEGVPGGGEFHKKHQELFDVPYDTLAYPTKLPGGRVEIEFPAGTNVSQWALAPGQLWVDLTIENAAARSTGPFQVRVHEREPVAGAFALPTGSKVRLLAPAGMKQLGVAEPETGSEGTEEEWTRWVVERTPEGRTIVLACAVNPGKPPYQGQPWRPMLAAAIVTNADGPDPVSKAKALVKRASELYRVKDSAWTLGPGASRHEAFNASGVTIPDARLQLHYDLCKHFYLSASRPDAPPIPLQGLWTADEGGLPPWKGDYHHDLNTQMTYLAYHDAGLREEGMSFVNQLWGLRARFERFAKEFYGLKGEGGEGGEGALVVPGVMGIDGAPLGGWGQYSLSSTHTAWLAQTFYLHWRYTHDATFLRERAYPWCAGAGRAMLGLLHEEAGPGGGKVLRLAVSSSPEIHDNSYAAWLPPNSNYDLALLRFLFAALEEMAREAGDAPGAGAWRGALEKLEPLDVDPVTHALTFARGHPYDQSHRHFSHAMAIYPLGTLTVEGCDEDRRTIAATIDQLVAKGPDWWCGYSYAWMSAMCARAGQGERALEYLTKYLSFTGPNGFHLNGDQSKSGLSKFTYRPFTLEGNFLAMQAVHEMLIQSWGEVGKGGGTIRVFPGVSAKWGDVSFRDLCAQGGFRVSAERKGGETVRVEVRAEVDGEARLRDPFDGKGVWEGAEVRGEGRDLLVRFKAGQRLEGKSK